MWFTSIPTLPLSHQSWNYLSSSHTCFASLIWQLPLLWLPKERDAATSQRTLTQLKRWIRKQDRRKEDHPRAMDDIVDQILSLLPTKSAVYMSYLSKPGKVVNMVVPRSLYYISMMVSHHMRRTDEKLEELQHRNFINILDRYIKLLSFKIQLTKGYMGFRAFKSLTISLGCLLNQ